MQTVKSLLASKKGIIYSVSQNSTVFDALAMMAENEIGAVLVIDDNVLQGVFSERDYARKVVLVGKSSKEILVRDVMTEKVFIIDGDCQIEECMKIMTEKRIRHLPVYENSQLVGVISVGDVIKSVVEEKQFVINQLEQYILGGRFIPQK